MNASDAALRRYGRTMRRQRSVYYGVVAVIVAALVVTVVVAFQHGETGHTTLHTVARGPADLPLSAPAGTQEQAWHTGDDAALSSPQWQGTVVTHDTHTVRGRDARTGRQTWSYTRSDRTVCAAVQADGFTVAVYELAGNCDELTALSTATGERVWTRTLDENGQPLFGHPSYQVASVDGYTQLMITSPTVVYTIRLVSGDTAGEDAWVYGRYGCQITHAVLGSAGALISQNCTHPQCPQGEKFCGRGRQLLLRSDTEQDSNNHSNPDQITWSRFGDTDVPVSADAVVSAVNATTRSLDVLDPDNGRVKTTLALQPTPAGTGPSTATPFLDFELLWIAGRAYAVLVDAPGVTWTTAAPASPTTIPRNTGSPRLTATRVTVPTATGARLISGSLGTTTRSFSLGRIARGAQVYSMGNGFLVAADGSTTAYTSAGTR